MSSLFRNSSPGALTREQAVELELKRLAERRLQQNSNSAAASKPFNSRSFTTRAPTALGFGGVNQPTSFGATGSGQPGGPGTGPSAPKSDGSLDSFLAGMSKPDLQGLKSALNDAAATTGVLEVFVAGALVAISAGTLLVTVTLGGLTIAAVSFAYFANKVDEYLSKQ